MADEPTVTCQVCGDSMTAAGAVWCSACETPHHPDCWNFAGACSTYGCGSREARRCGTAVVSGRLAPPLHVPFEGPPAAREVYDRCSSLKSLLFGAMIVAVCWCLHGILTADPGPGCGGGLLAVLFGLLCRHTEGTYQWDPGLRALLYVRTLGRFRQEWPVCSPGEAHAVTIDGRCHSSEEATWWEYALVVVGRDGCPIRISDYTQHGLGVLRVAARRLADRLGCPAVLPAVERRLVVERNARDAVIVRHRPYAWSLDALPPAFAWTLLLPSLTFLFVWLHGCW